MSIFSLTCPDVGCYQNFLCDPEFQNKIIAVAYVRKAAALTPAEKADADSWIAALYDRYLNGEGYLVFNTSGEKPKPETATTAGRGMQNTKALAKTHTLTYQDMQGVVQNNVQFYNDILASAQNYDFYYFTPGRIWDASGYYVTVIGDPIITADLNTYQMAEVTVNWVSKVVGAISGEPALIWSVEQSSGSDPISEIGLSFTDNVLTWNPNGSIGTYVFVVTVTNEYGCVFGQQTITLTVNCD